MSVMSIKFIMFNGNLLSEICEQFPHPLTIRALLKQMCQHLTKPQNINQPNGNDWNFNQVHEFSNRIERPPQQKKMLPS